ncbi:DsbA family protein [Endozoicomonas elysicola]|uniref:Thioredoxin n=1 Tax=Endozoicomonas elysicola TaxID=305900 RepID=A0A081KDY8_9GAMM|nr:DsbA family protein [Endozoicomonas elysicola]KEI72364.1 thioredoxin [Endozoicomonas elysicola]
MATLIYVHDPMCSWCWGFAPVWQKVYRAIQQGYEPDELSVRSVVGGLAPDSDEPMPIEMAKRIRSYWHEIEQLLGTEFNYDFWVKNIPRRSTYLACRAVIAARELSDRDGEFSMNTAIQQAYYLKAENPSDLEVLLNCAGQIGLDRACFEQFINSPECKALLTKEIRFSRSIGGNSFPSLFLEKRGTVYPIPVDYKSASGVLECVADLMQ